MKYSATWTAKRVNAYLKNITGGDAYVERARNGYNCFDSYRPGMTFWGKTPKAACIAAGWDGILYASDSTYAS